MYSQFKEIMDHFKNVPGAISFTEAIAAMLVIDKYLPEVTAKGIAVDLGTHMGKIACIESYMLAKTPNDIKEFCLVDPLFDMMNDKEWERSYVKLTKDRKPEGWQIFDNHNEFTLNNVSKAAPTSLTVTPYGLSSLSFFNQRTDPIALMMVDSGDHLHDIVFSEIELFKDRVVPNGLVFYHDFANQFTAPLEGVQYLCKECGYEQIEMPWKEAEFLAEMFGLEEKDNNSWLNYGDIQYYNFMGCCRKKEV